MRKVIILFLSISLLCVCMCACSNDAGNLDVSDSSDQESQASTENLEPATDPEQETSLTEEQTSEPTEEVVLGPLEGFLDNLSYEVNTSTKTYQIYQELKLEGSFEDIIATMLEKGLTELVAPEDNYTGGLAAEYGFEDEYDRCYIKIEKNDDIFDTLYYVAYGGPQTGFHASEEVYYALGDKLDVDITTLAQIQEYFGKGFLQSQRIVSDGTIIYEYAWTNNNDMIWCFTDSEGILTGYQIGCTSLPATYEE